MEIKLLGEKRAVLVKIDGELDHHIAGSLRETVDSKIRCTNAVNVIFDFSNVGFMDSSGIGILLGRYKRMHHMGGEVLVTGEDAKIRRLLRISGVYQVVGTL